MNTDTEQTQHELLTDEQVAVIRGVAERLANGAGMWLYAGTLPLASVHVPALLADRAALVRRVEVAERTALMAAGLLSTQPDYQDRSPLTLYEKLRSDAEAEVPPCAD